MQAAVAGDAVGRSSALDESLARAHQLAVNQGHASVALEHLLFALTDDPEAAGLLASGRASIDQLRTDVSAHIGRLGDVMPAEAGKAPVPGADLLRILQLAGMAARQSQRRTIDGGIVLAAVIGDGNSPAAGLLKAHGLTFDDAIRALQQVGPPRQQELASEPKRAELPPPAAPAQAPAETAPTRRTPAASSHDVLANARARIKLSEPQAIKTVATPAPVQAPPPAAPLARPEPDTRPSRPATEHPAARSPPSLAAPPVPPRPQEGPLRPGAPPAAMPPVPLPRGQASPPGGPLPLALLHQTGSPNGTAAVAMPPPMQPPQPPPHMQAPPAAQIRPPPPQPVIPQPAVARGPAPPQHQPHRTQGPQPPPAVLLPIEPLDIVGAAGGLPASVRRHVPVLVEIRIPRAQVDVPRHGPYAHGGGGLVRAATVRLTSGPVSGLSIEPRTPETAWLGPAEVEANARDIVWQFVLLPTRPGVFAVTLHVTGRTFAPGGMTSDIASAAETFAVRVRGERGRGLRRMASWLALLAVGGAIGWALTGPLAGLVRAALSALQP